MVAKKKKKVRTTVRKKRTAKKSAVRRQPKKKTVKKVLKKTAKKKVPAKAKAKAKLAQDVIGSVTHYFPKVRAAVIKLKAPLSVGDSLKIKGHTTDFTQSVTSMQIDRVPITSGKKGQEIGLLVVSRVRQGDIAYKA